MFVYFCEQRVVVNQQLLQHHQCCFNCVMGPKPWTSGKMRGAIDLFVQHSTTGPTGGHPSYPVISQVSRLVSPMALLQLGILWSVHGTNCAPIFFWGWTPGLMLQWMRSAAAVWWLGWYSRTLTAGVTHEVPRHVSSSLSWWFFKSSPKSSNIDHVK